MYIRQQKYTKQESAFDMPFKGTHLALNHDPPFGKLVW